MYKWSIYIVDVDWQDRKIVFSNMASTIEEARKEMTEITLKLLRSEEWLICSCGIEFVGE